MEVVNMHDVKKRLSELIKKVLDGESVVISSNNEPLVQIIPLKKEQKIRKLGILKGKFWSCEDCWQSDDEIISSVETSEIFPE